ncbi:MAG: DUF3303 family protein [Candidatus Hodarchaeota archaeon]
MHTKIYNYLGFWVDAGFKDCVVVIRCPSNRAIIRVSNIMWTTFHQIRIIEILLVYDCVYIDV